MGAATGPVPDRVPSLTCRVGDREYAAAWFDRCVQQSGPGRWVMWVVGLALVTTACGTTTASSVASPSDRDTLPRVGATEVCSDWWSQTAAMQLRIAELYRNMAVDSGPVPTAPQLRSGIDSDCRANLRRPLLDAIKAAIWSYQQARPTPSSAG